MRSEGDGVRGALVRELSTWFGDEPRLTREAERLGDSISSDCFRFDIAEPPEGIPQRLVLRLMRDDRSAARERVVQNALAQSGFPAPRVHRSGPSTSAFGRPFSIMAFIDGRDPVAAGMMQTLPQVLAKTMCALHAVDTDVDLQADPDIVEDLRRSEQEAVARAALWFDRNPIDGARVICHGDLHARNVLMRNETLAAVLDWELAARAPRTFDVARSELLLLLMPGVGSPLLRPLVRLLGRRAAARFVRAYGAIAPLDPVTLDRCRALHALRLVALIRSEASVEGVRALWRPFEKTLARRWTELTGVPLA